jgi:CheY-like chemotaxis protein/HPt (histidine-containing phosphotransfer) domain-containing protein
VHESGESLLGLINDILDFSKIEAGRLELDSTIFHLSESLGDTMKSLALRAHSKHLELAFSVDPSVPPVVVGDVGRLRQVVLNLVGNAIKFTAEGEVVLEVATVSCDGDQPGDAVELLFTVTDTGIGIPAEQQEAIFGAFRQADTSTTRRYGGTGLGLAISVRLVELMDGKIWLQSEPGRGSTFSFTARFEIGEETEGTHSHSAVGIADTPVIVIDDNATNRRILRDMLTNWGMRPTPVSNAATGLQIMRDAKADGHPFRLIITDLNMPDIDGFEFMEKVRADDELKSIPAVMLTSSGRPGELDIRDQLKIYAQLLKPVKQSDLFDTIVGALGVNSPEGRGDLSRAGQTLRVRPLKVLLAEDNAINQKLAIGLLEPEGHEVTVANTGRQALEKFKGGGFDVVLMDVQMPEMDGLEATGAIRAHEQAEKLGRTPIIAMTAHAMKGDRERCIEAGMDDYLSKPIHVRAVREMLAQQFGGELVDDRQGPEGQDEDELEINWKSALSDLGDDENLLSEILKICLEDTPVGLKALRDAVDSGDAKGINSQAHTLKGSLLFLGGTPAVELAREMETFGAGGEIDKARAGIDRLETAFAALLAEIEKKWGN